MIIFRVDGNERIGAGHIMRCLSIADAAQERGIHCEFVLADDSFEAVIKERGYSCVVLHTVFYNMDDELQSLISILEEKNFDVIIVDSYYVTDAYLIALRQFGIVVYIDDFMTTAYSVDAIINYNIYSEENVYRDLYHVKNREMPRLILGTQYVPLRKEFLGIKKRNISTYIRKVLISTGGADTEHIALNFIKHIQASLDLCRIYEFHFVLGLMNQDVDIIKTLSEGLPNVVLHQNVKNMEELMQQCDVAVSAAGSTLYELCACGVPTITYVLADNQIQAEKCFVEAGIMETAGDFRCNEVFFPEIACILECLNSNMQRRKEMAVLGGNLVDGTGANNIIDTLQCLL